jgi:ABC-2 type transport system ATP-binding protein
MIIVENISKNIKHKIIINNVSFTCVDHSIFGLLGSNGAGKTSILRILNGLFTIDEGNVTILGLNPFTQKEELHKYCGISTEESKMYPDITIMENLDYYSGFFPKKIDDSEFKRISEELSLSDILNNKYKELSAGNKKKADLLRTLIPMPSIIYWDEPFANLDPESSTAVINLIQYYNTKYGTTFFITSHDLNYCQTFCSHVGFLFNGCMPYYGTLEDVYRKYHCNNLSDAYFSIKGDKNATSLTTHVEK